jgi:hypothetical protein
MKTLSLIVVLFALLVALKGGKAIVFPGDNILIYQDVKYGERTVKVGVVYDAEGKEVTKIPADLIYGIGAIDDDELKPKAEM